MRKFFYKVLAVGLFCITLGTNFSLYAEITKSKPITKKIEPMVAELQNTVVKAARDDAPEYVGQGNVVAGGCDLTPVLKQLGKANICCKSVLETVEEIDFREGTPIYSAETPYTISIPGKYYLAEDIVGDFSSTKTAISVKTDDVYLDLNGMTTTNSGALVGSVAIDIVQGANKRNVVVTGGSIIGFQTGIIVEASCKNIQLLKLIIKQCNTGINIYGLAGLITNILLKDCFIDNNQSGVLAQTCNNINILNCYANNNSYTGNVAGFNFSNCSLGKIEDSGANSNSSSGGNAYGFELNNSSDFIFINCDASQNGTGFMAISGYKNIFKDCIASDNTAIGFLFNAEYYDSILNSFAKKNGTYGISLIGTETSWIRANEVVENGNYGIYLSGYSSFNQIESNKLLENTYLGTGTNLFVDASSINNVVANTHAYTRAGSNYSISTVNNYYISPVGWTKGSTPTPSYYVDNLDIQN